MVKERGSNELFNLHAMWKTIHIVLPKGVMSSFPVSEFYKGELPHSFLPKICSLLWSQALQKLYLGNSVNESYPVCQFHTETILV